jgi:hypothetical protein
MHKQSSLQRETEGARHRVLTYACRPKRATCWQQPRNIASGRRACAQKGQAGISALATPTEQTTAHMLSAPTARKKISERTHVQPLEGQTERQAESALHRRLNRKAQPETHSDEPSSIRHVAIAHKFQRLDSEGRCLQGDSSAITCLLVSPCCSCSCVNDFTGARQDTRAGT